MPGPLRLAAITGLAMLAFAANSLLARLALAEGASGPWSFVLLRIAAGALMLGLLVGPRDAARRGSWRGGAALLCYAAGFSYAYLWLSTGTGALILFAAVQVTMLGAGFLMGERLGLPQRAGLALAIGGLVVLLAPGLAAPPLPGAVLMAGAGAAWGAYSLLGRTAGDPTAQTAGNFARAAVLASVLSAPVLLLWPEAPPTAAGAGLAMLSGAVTSGLGYAVWYRVLPSLTATRAGIAQLCVPPLAALAGILVLGEPATLRFAVAGAVILLGVGAATIAWRRPAREGPRLRRS